MKQTQIQMKKKIQRNALMEILIDIRMASGRGLDKRNLFGLMFENLSLCLPGPIWEEPLRAILDCETVPATQDTVHLFDYEKPYEITHQSHCTSWRCGLGDCQPSLFTWPRVFCSTAYCRLTIEIL